MVDSCIKKIIKFMLKNGLGCERGGLNTVSACLLIPSKELPGYDYYYPLNAVFCIDEESLKMSCFINLNIDVPSKDELFPVLAFLNDIQCSDYYRVYGKFVVSDSASMYKSETLISKDEESFGALFNEFFNLVKSDLTFFYEAFSSVSALNAPSVVLKKDNYYMGFNNQCGNA